MAFCQLFCRVFQGLLASGYSQFGLADFDFILSLIAEDDDVDLCRVPDKGRFTSWFFIYLDSSLKPDGFCSIF